MDTKIMQKGRHALLEFCTRFKRIYLYGAGRVAAEVYSLFSDEGIVVDGFFTTTGQDELFMSKEVLRFSDFTFSCFDGVIIAVGEDFQNSIREELQKNSSINLNTQVYYQNSFAMNQKPLSEEDYGYEFDKSDPFFDHCNELNDIGLVTGTDKSSRCHDYLKKYEFFLKKWKNDTFTLLELGVCRGDSLKMWEEYFKNASIIGVDIDKYCKTYENERTKVEIRDLSSEKELENLSARSYRLIIDDASHMWSHQIKGFLHLFSSLEHGGIYILEDIGTSFGNWTHSRFGDADFSTYEVFSLLSELITGGENIYMPSLRDLEKELFPIAKEISFIGFMYWSCIVVKK